MYLVYDDEQPRRSGGKLFDFASANASKFYLEHYRNFMFLKFMAYNKLSTYEEKARALKELIVCERKMEYWKRHINYNSDVVNAGIVEILKEWR